MKKCYKCNISLNTKGTRCPLCQSIIDTSIECEDIFPVIENNNNRTYKLVYKILLFISIFGCITCLILNWLISKKISWSLFVIAGIISFWFTFVIGLKKRNDTIKLLFVEMILVLISSIIWDYFTGLHFWSITYVLPFISISYISALLIIRLFIKNVFKEHIIYIYINLLIGLLPLYFILKNKLTIEWPSIVCVIFSIFVILLLAIFNHKQMKDELERRLHI